MLVYPGGTYRDHSTSGYQFFHNYLSDLGATVAHNGQPNRVGALLFVVSLVALVVGMGALLVALTRVYARSRGAVAFTRLAAIAGTLVCALFIGVAATPENHFMPIHVLFTKLAFRTFPAVPLFLGLAARRNPALPPRVSVAWLVMIVLLVSYVLILDFGPRSSTPTGLVVQVTAQKIVTIGAVLLLVYQSYQAERLTLAKSAQQPSIGDRRSLVPGD